MLKDRYGDLSIKVFCGGDSCKVTSSCSTWWKDIIMLGNISSNDTIVSNTRFIIRNGFITTPFLEAKWIEYNSLKEIFLDLFSASCLKIVSVAGMGGRGVE